MPGVLILSLIAFVIEEAFPSQQDILWALSAATCGGFGMAALYKGLSTGNAATIAPSAAVIGAGIPVRSASLLLGIC